MNGWVLRRAVQGGSAGGLVQGVRAPFGAILGAVAELGWILGWDRARKIRLDGLWRFEDREADGAHHVVPVITPEDDGAAMDGHLAGGAKGRRR
jgi:hypothetical protein